MDLLEAEGWLENSIIVVAGDNGGCPSAGGCNYRLRGTKGSMFEAGTKVKTLNCLFFDEEYLVKNFITCFPSAVTIFFFWWRRQCAKAQLQLSFNFDNNSCVYARCMRVACACYLSSVKGVRYPKFGINVTGNATATEKEPLIRSWGFNAQSVRFETVSSM